MKACQETTACHEATNADLEKIEPDPGMMQSVGEHQEVPKEHATMKPVKGRMKQRRGRKLTAGRRGEPKELTQGYCGSRKRVTVAGRRTSRDARVAWRKWKFKKIGTQGNCGPWMRLTVARRKTTRCATVAWCIENVVMKDWIRNQAKRGTPKRRKDGRRLWKDPECN
jgi:hypothetical protein